MVGEPYLRMISTGSAAVGTSVMVHFPLAGPIDRLIHGMRMREWLRDDQQFNPA